MKGIRYTAEFKAEAIKQITERGHTVADVAQRLGISTKSLYKWMQEADVHKQPAVSCDIVALKQEVARLNAAFKAYYRRT
jgi:transposase